MYLEIKFNDSHIFSKLFSTYILSNKAKNNSLSVVPFICFKFYKAIMHAYISIIKDKRMYII